MLVLKGAQLIDGTGGNPIKDAAIVIDGKRIKQVGVAGQVDYPADAQVIDMAGCTLMPGMTDCHVHLMAQNVLSFHNPRVAAFEVTPEMYQMYGLLHAQMMFEMGFTTIRDLGWIVYSGVLTKQMLAVREAINYGLIAGPRLLVAGWAVNTGSHLDIILIGNAPRNLAEYGDSPWELRKQVRTNLRMHCDLIKTCASGGGGTDKESPDIRNMTQEELNAIVEESHYFRKPVSCHCFTPEAQKMSVLAGVDTIEHCVFTDDEALDMMKEANKPVIPTLQHRSDRAIECRRRVGTSQFTLDKMKGLQPFTKETFMRLHRKGIKIAMGTDMQIDAEMASNAHELEIYVNYGMTPMEAILTTTKNAAEALWLDKDLGTLEAGKLADVLVVDGNPLDDIKILQERQKIRMVMKEGRVFVDRRAGQEKYVIHDQSWGWKIF